MLIGLFAEAIARGYNSTEETIMGDPTGFNDEALLRITGTETDGNTVPFEVLVRVLDAMQQTVYLLAAAQTKKLKRRFKATEAMKKRYQLRAEVPQAGSYALPLTIGLPEIPLELNDTPSSVLAQFYSVLDSIHSEDDSKLMDIIPDEGFLRRALRELLKFLPKPGERWGVGFTLGTSSELRLDSRSTRLVERWLKEATTGDEALMTVTGDLVRIDFDEQKVVIRYKPDGRRIECFYLPDVEEVLLSNPRELIQVTGKFSLDEESLPTKMVEVSMIEAVDLSPLTFEAVLRNGRLLVMKTPLVLSPALDAETNQYLEVGDPSLGLQVFANNREILVEEIEEQLFMLWDEYALAEPETLVEAAQQVQKALLERIEEVDYVAER